MKTMMVRSYVELTVPAAECENQESESEVTDFMRMRAENTCFVDRVDFIREREETR